MGIELIPLKTYFGEEEYRDGIDLDHDGFFQKLIETDVFPTTSQISHYEYEETNHEKKIIFDSSDIILNISFYGM